MGKQRFGARCIKCQARRKLFAVLTPTDSSLDIMTSKQTMDYRRVDTSEKCRATTTSRPCKSLIKHATHIFSYKYLSLSISFDGMGIIHTAKRNIEDVLVEKMSAEREFETRRPISANELTAIKNEAKKQAKDMNLNQACLCFQAYFKNEADNTWVKIGEPAFSNIVNNLKSALYGGLRITRMSTFTSEAKGGQEVFMFVEKLCKSELNEVFSSCATTNSICKYFQTTSRSDSSKKVIR